jgi:hypothetical protein
MTPMPMSFFVFDVPRITKNNVKILPIMPPCPWSIPQGWECVDMKEAA